MSAREVRTRLIARLADLRYEPLGAARAQEDAVEDPQTGHRATIVPFPRWGRRVDILTVESSFPLPQGGRAIGFRLDVGSQIHPEGESVPGRWAPSELERICERIVVPYLDRGRTADDVLAMLIEGEIRPAGSAAASTVLQHGYFLAKWWQLTDRIAGLRDLAELVPATERVRLQHAPWGRTELAEVLWFGRDLPVAPNRLPWGPGDQGDPRAERWFRTAPKALRESVTNGATASHPVQSPRTV